MDISSCLNAHALCVEPYVYMIYIERERKVKDGDDDSGSGGGERKITLEM